MKKTTVFTGSSVAVTTPFKADGSIDTRAFESILDYVISNNTDAITVCGTTGESATLTDKEKNKLTKICLKRTKNKIPVIAGTGSNNTRRAIELSKAAEDCGADALLIVTPYYNKTTQQGLAEHYFKIADSVNLPIIIYNVPSRTGLNILPQTYKVLAEHPNIAAIKEANGNITALTQTISLCKNALDVYSGDDALITPMLSLGAKGVISVLANILPATVHEICTSFFEGDTEKSAELQTEYSDLISALFIQTNPIPVKYAQSLLGLCEPYTRLPLTAIGDSAAEALKTAMKRHGLI